MEINQNTPVTFCSRNRPPAPAIQRHSAVPMRVELQRVLQIQQNQNPEAYWLV